MKKIIFIVLLFILATALVWAGPIASSIAG
jgi:hypothetical protein